MQVSSGAFSYQEAIKNAVKNVAENGATVLYPSGHTERIDVAVSRAVLTGVGQTCREIGIMNAEECGCDLMEISAHSGARPDHAKWQGQLVSLSGKNAGRTISEKKSSRSGRLVMVRATASAVGTAVMTCIRFLKTTLLQTIPKKNSRDSMKKTFSTT